MIRQDYILREIERMIEFCVRILGVRRQEDENGLETFLGENCETLTGLRYDTLVATPSAKLVTLLNHPGTPSFARLVACGCLLCEAADASRLAGRPDEARERFLRGVEVLAFTAAQEEPGAQPLIARHLARLEGRIAGFPFSAGERARLGALFASAKPVR